MFLALTLTMKSLSITFCTQGENNDLNKKEYCQRQSIFCISSQMDFPPFSSRGPEGDNFGSNAALGK